MTGRTLQILFVGNSFTARNDLPSVIAQLAAAHGIVVEHRLISAGGASLRMHLNAGKAQAEMAKRQYDYVVLQEQSTLPIKNANRMHENIREFDTLIRRAKAKTVLYMTWARRNAPESQQTITDAYQSIGAELDAVIVPVGAAWQAFRRKHTEPVLHDQDQSHPTVAGSYLAACCFCATLFGEDPSGSAVTISGLTDKHRLLLEKTAWQTCKPIVAKARRS
jgi:hypothetical protein